MNTDVEKLLQAYHRINSLSAVGDTKYDLFNRGGPLHNQPSLTREQLRHARTAPRRKYAPPTSGAAAKIHPKRIV